MSTAPVLIVGNGFNRMTKSGGVPWNRLLILIAEAAGYHGMNPENKSLPLAFEEILGTVSSSPAFIANPDLELKRIAADIIGDAVRNEWHDRLLELPVRHILTTNYDYALFDRNRGSPVSPERKYSLFRARKRENGRTVWHIHGECAVPDTLLLGHDHYVRYAGRIMEYLRRPSGKIKSREQDWNASTASSPLVIGNMEFDKEWDSQISSLPMFSWVDLMLARDIHIVGLSLDFSEIVLWWMLTVRSRESQQRIYGLEVIIDATPPRTIWWDCVLDDVSTKRYTEAKQEVAEGLGVEVRVIHVQKHSDSKTQHAAFAEAWNEQLDRMHEVLKMK